MEDKFTIDPFTDARAFADTTEQMAQEVRRTARNVESIATDVKYIYETVVAPFIEWLMAPPAGPPAKVQVLASTDGGR